MQRVRINKKRKSTLTRRKRTLSRGNSQYLELLLKENSGNSSTYYVPVKATVVNGRLSKKYTLQQSSKTSNTWMIVSETARVVTPEELVNKKVSLRKGNISVNGIVLSAKPLGKGPEGNPVPTPPPALDGGNSSE